MLDGIAVVPELTEVVIRVRSRRGGLGRDANAELQDALRQLRQQRYEVDLFIRGTWMRIAGGQGARAVSETLIHNWKLTNGSLDCSKSIAELGTGEIRPCPTRRPWPEIVLRGVRTCVA